MNLINHFKIQAFIVFIIIVRLLSWYNPFLGNKVALFQSSVPVFNIKNITKTHYFNELRLQSNSSGKYLIFNTPEGEIFTSVDYGASWKPVYQLPSWQALDFDVDDDGNFTLFFSPIHNQNEGASIIYKSLNSQNENVIYQAKAQTINGVTIGNDIRGINFYRAGNNLYLNAFEGYATNWQYTLLKSQDLKNWFVESSLTNLNHPDINLISLGSLAVDKSNNKYLSLTNNALDVTQIKDNKFLWAKEPSLTVYKNEDQTSWNVDTKDLGKNGPGTGFENLVPNQSQIFASGNNIYLFWHHSYSKLQAASLVNPIDVLIHVPYTNILFASALPNQTRRDDIYFINLTSKNIFLTQPIRLNDTALTYDVTEIPYQNTQQQVQSFKDKAEKYFVRLRSAASLNGRYLAAAWTDYRQVGTRPIYLTYTKDFGKTWSKNQLVFPNLTDMTNYFDLKISDTGKINLVFSSPKDNNVYYVDEQIN